MGILVWIMMGLAIWHFTVFLPDHFMGGIVGAFLGATIGAVIGGVLITGFDVPGKDDTELLTAFEGIPGTLLGLGLVWFLGVREERNEAATRGGLASR
jgi:hypothetical protein